MTFSVRWNSTICSCQATRGQHKEHGEYKACCEEHEPWLLIIGSQEMQRKQVMIENAISKGIPKSFDSVLTRFGKGDATFHRPKEVPQDQKAPGAEMGFYLVETFGVYLDSCSNPSRYTDYLANKATRGLSEKFWKEDHFKRYEDTSGFSPARRFECEIKYVWPEELVAEGLMTASEAEIFFLCKLDLVLLEHFQ